MNRALGGVTSGVAYHTPLFLVDKGERFAFGFVRNPWARSVSHYRFLCRKVLRAGDGIDQEHLRRLGYKRWLLQEPIWMPQDEEWMTDDLPPMQSRSQMWWLRGCDFIGQVENITEDWRTACERAGIRHRELPHINQMGGGDWREEHDADTRAFIAKHFAEEIERFGYGF